METIPLTIATDYLPSWGVTEGLRELVQNWLDANEDGEGEIAEDGATVRMINRAARLSREALLLGVSSKRDATDKRGKHGEGMKVGALALVRAGRTVAIEAGGERWTASLAYSEAFGRDVLTWTVEESEVPHVEVEVGHLEDGEWADVAALFRDLTPDKHVATDSGALLLDNPGAVYVRGIFVSREGLRWGYDLQNATVDRDRRLVRGWELTCEAGQILAAAMAGGSPPARDVFEALASGTTDTGALTYYVSGGDRAAVLAAFRAAHGAKAAPVKDAGHQQRLASLGIQGVVVHEHLVDFLAPLTGTFDAIVREALNEVVEVHLSLTDAEVEVLRWAIDEIRAVTNLCASHIVPAVVTYRTDTTMGMFVGGKIQIARRLLSDRHDTLATLIHEVAHVVGGDGEVAHTATIEGVWTALSRRWHSAPPTLRVAS